MSLPQAVVIGYGHAGKAFHAYLIGLESGLSLRGVASRDPQTRERIVAEQGCRAYASFEEVLGDEEADLVVLATPHDTHADLAVRAMDAGKAVVTDKPMCVDLAECDRMIESAARNGVLLQVFQNRRWDGDYLTLRKLLDEGALGDLRWLEMAWTPPRAPGGWRGRKDAGGGRFYDLGAHLLDQVLTLLPERVTSVYCRMHHDYAEVDVESHAMCVLGFANGATGVVDVGGMHKLPKPRIQAFGSRGAFVKHGKDPQEAAMKAGDIDAAVEPPGEYGRFSDGQAERTIPTVRGDWKQFYRNVAEVLAGAAEPAIKLTENRRLMAVYDAAWQSAASGAVVMTDIEPA